MVIWNMYKRNRGRDAHSNTRFEAKFGSPVSCQGTDPDSLSALPSRKAMGPGPAQALKSWREQVAIEKVGRQRASVVTVSKKKKVGRCIRTT